MKREIKFRALDYMSKWHIGYYRHVKHSPVNGKYINQFTIHNGTFEQIISPSTLGQFTGLCDKNGAEIYEEDVLHTPWGNDVVVFSDSCFRMRGCGSVLAYVVKRNRIKVIGNIHQNKDLL